MFLRIVPLFAVEATYKVLSEHARLEPRTRTYMRYEAVISHLDRNYKCDSSIAFSKEYTLLLRALHIILLPSALISDMGHIFISPRTDTWAIDTPIVIMTKVTIKD